MELRGYTKGEYFHIDCLRCEERVDVTRVWFDGVPNIDVACKKCNETDVFKLMPARWGGLVKLLMK
jgi:hypothetical protein